MYEYMQRLKKLRHRNLCSIIDYEIDDSRANKRIVYSYSEAYNASLMDLYRTSKNENVEFLEEQVIEIAFQILKALSFLN